MKIEVCMRKLIDLPQMAKTMRKREKFILIPYKKFFLAHAEWEKFENDYR